MKLKILNPPRFDLEKVIEIYKSKLSLVNIESPDITVFDFEKFDVDHNYLRNCSGCYDFRENLILINHQCSTPVLTLFHEFGHHIYQKILNGDQIHIWKTYYYQNFKKIKIDKFLRKYPFTYEGYIPPKISNFLEFCEVYENKECFTKLETYYAPNSEEAFCETFATYIVNGKCLHKSNTRIMKGLLESYENRTI